MAPYLDIRVPHSIENLVPITAEDYSYGTLTDPSQFAAVSVPDPPSQ